MNLVWLTEIVVETEEIVRKGCDRVEISFNLIQLGLESLFLFLLELFKSLLELLFPFISSFHHLIEKIVHLLKRVCLVIAQFSDFKLNFIPFPLQNRVEQVPLFVHQLHVLEDILV
jgi:hypothetical protein